jgi:hypothetical protein
MKTSTAIIPGLHLVPAASEPTASDPGDDLQIAEGVRAFQRLQQQIDNVLFSPSPDPDVLASLLRDRNLVGERLAAHGIKVRA